MSEIKWIYYQAPGSFDLVHFILPTLLPVFPTEGRFGKDTAFASSTAHIPHSYKPLTLHSLAQTLLGSPLRYS